MKLSMGYKIAHHDQLIRQAESFVTSHLDQSFSIKDVAQDCSVSYSHFNNLFSFYQGEPFWQFVKRKRLEYAAGLLRHSGHSVSDIAELSGYGTKHSFAKAFVSHFSFTAREYRGLETLPEQAKTLSVVKLFSKLDADKLWEDQKPQRIKLPDLKLYYTIPSKDKPVEEYVANINFIRASLQLSLKKTDTFIRVVTGTHDAVPATSYEKLKAYFGIILPRNSSSLLRLYPEQLLFEKNIPGGNYLRLDLPMDCMTAGLLAYTFIDRATASGYFKMAGNHFFIALLNDFACECYIPLYA